MSTVLPRVVLVAMTLLMLTACASSPAAPAVKEGQRDPNAAVTLGLSFDILNNIRQAEKAAIEAKAKQLGATVVFTVADGDAQRQAAQIQDLLKQRVSAIIAIAQDKQAIVGAIKQANAAGVPFLTLDREVAPGGTVALHVGADPYSDGRVAAQYMAYTAAAKGRDLKVLVLVGDLADANAVERNRGFKEEIAHWPNITIVNEAPTEWKPEQAEAATEQALQAHPDLNAVFCPSDYLLPSVLSSLQAADKLAAADDQQHIMIVSIDGDPFGYSKTADKVISADVATLVDVMGARVTERAVEAARGQALPSNKEIVPGLLFSYHNASAVAANVWGAQIRR
jgi:ABC-type sugar transport system substrate-binding protein